VGLPLLAAAIVGVRLPQPRLCVAAFAGLYLSALLAIVHTAISKPAAGYTGNRAWLVALAFVLGAKGGALLVRLTLAAAFQMPSGSMVPTLLVGDHMFVSKGRSDVARGDVIVFEFPPDRSTDYVKRVVAVGGDTVEIDGAGVVSINGAPLAHEPIDAPCEYRDDSAHAPDPPDACTLVRETNAGRSYTIMLTPDHPAMDHPRTTVPPGSLFVLGDNRDNSYDSRRWGFVPVDHVKGKATVIWWSQGPQAGVRWSRVGHGIE
jgi:signal peptidase I